MIATEELARVSASVALSYGAHANLCANNIATNGSEEQKQRYLPGLCRGTEVGALALTEPEAGSDAIGIRTAAVREGDIYRLNGTKMFITNGSVADTLVLYAKTDPEAGSRGITAFIVESSFDGFSVGQRLDKVGHRGSPTAELLLEDCIVPADNVLGREGGGAAVMMQGLAVERSFLAGEPLGIAQAALDAAVAYARTRRQFGQRIGDFQLIQAMLADMYTELEAARWLVYRTASLVEDRAARGERTNKEAAAAILYSAEMSSRVADKAVQIPRRLRLHVGVPRRPLRARRQAARNRRRHQRNPPPPHRPRTRRAPLTTLSGQRNPDRKSLPPRGSCRAATEGEARAEVR